MNAFLHPDWMAQQLCLELINGPAAENVAIQLILYMYALSPPLNA